jgi:hypothetical protein
MRASATAEEKKGVLEILGITYETKAKRKLIELRASAAISKDEILRLKSSHEKETRNLQEQHCDEFTFMQKRLDFLKTEKVAIALETLDLTQEFQSDITRLKTKNMKLVEEVIALDVALSDAKEDFKVNDELCKEFWEEKEEMTNRVSVLETSALIATEEQERSLLLIDVQSQTIAKLRDQLAAQGQK